MLSSVRQVTLHHVRNKRQKMTAIQATTQSITQADTEAMMGVVKAITEVLHVVGGNTGKGIRASA